MNDWLSTRADALPRAADVPHEAPTLSSRAAEQLLLDLAPRNLDELCGTVRSTS